MKKSLLLLFSLIFFTAQDTFANYFLNQIAASAVAGGAAVGVNRASKQYRLANPNANTLLFLGSYITLKFFYDALNANTTGEFFKSFVSVPLNTGVAFGSSFVINSFTK